MKNLPDVVQSYAQYSVCKLYRYALIKAWRPDWLDNELALWIMLNPSTATENSDDPTVRRCQVFSRMYGYKGVCIVNLFALRSTDPRGLLAHVDPVGPDNDSVLAVRLNRHRNVFVAWGSWKYKVTRPRIERVCLMMRCANPSVRCLGVNGDGQPKHPLYLPLDRASVGWDYIAGRGVHITEDDHAGTLKKQGKKRGNAGASQRRKDHDNLG